MMRKTMFMLSLLLAMLATCDFAMGASIYVPNNSFETPTLDPGAYTFFNPGSGENISGDWVQSHTAAAGVVNNTLGAFGAQPTGVDGSNVGWLVNGQGIWQDLDLDTFQVGYTYRLTVSVAARADMPGASTDTLRLNLFGGRDGLNPNVASFTDVLNSSMSTTAMTDFTVTIPEVLSSDLWAGQRIGIWINNTVGGGGTGYWLDNIRLTADLVPVVDSSWNSYSGGDWSDQFSWDPIGVPNGTDVGARFNKALGAGTIAVNQDVANLTVSSMVFASPSGESYTITGQPINLHSSVNPNWTISVSGTHAIGANLSLQSGTDASAINLADAAQLTLSGVVSNESDAADVHAVGTGGLGTGVLTLSGANLYTGATTATNCVLEVPTLGNVASANTLGMSNAAPENLVLTNAKLRYTGTTAASTDRGLTVQGDSTIQPAGNMAINGKLVGAAGTTLNVNGAGTLTCGYTGSEGSDLSWLNVGIADNGYLDLPTGSTMNLSSHLCVGYLGAGHGEMNVAAGANLTVSGWLVVGYSQSQSDLGATGVLNNSGTIVHNADLTAENNLVIGRTGDSVFNQNAGSVIDNAAGVNLGQWGNTGTLNLNGGVFSTSVIQAGYIADEAAKGTINFNGGTLQVNTAGLGYERYTVGLYGGTFINPLISTAGNFRVFVKENGATIDTNGANIKIGVPIETGIETTDGGLTKIGAGTLSLSLPNTYTGPTVIKDGTLQVKIVHQAMFTGPNAVGDRTDGPQSLGRDFLVNAGKSIQVTKLGVFDSAGDGLAVDHVLHLLNQYTNEETTVTLLAGTSASYQAGYRFLTLGTPLSLAEGSYKLWVDGMGGEGNDAFGQNIGGTDVGGSGALTFLSAWTGATPGTMPDTEWLTGGNSAFASFVFYDPSSVISAHVLVSTTPVLLGGAAGSTPTLDLQGANQEIASLADVAGAAVKGVVTNSAPDMPVVLTLGALTGMTEYSGAIEGNISLVKNGGSTQSLTGSLTYTGDTTVNGGTLIVNDLNMPSSTISVMDGAVLEARSIVADTLSIGGTPLVNAAPPAAVPEPGTLILLTLAAIGMLLAIRRK